MNYYMPQWEERTSYGFRRIDPYAKLFEDRIIYLGSPISDDVANAVIAQLMCLESMNPDQDIQIYINSPGGSFTALTAIYDTMNFIKPDVQTVCIGQAASAAAILLGAAMAAAAQRSGRVDGAVVLLRDVSELRSRDRLLVSKDATIKEIHHRVKNNLQTISSLLRLQGRRLTEPSAKAAIEESVRRIRSIALVHETLSREDGDEVGPFLPDVPDVPAGADGLPGAVSPGAGVVADGAREGAGAGAWEVGAG